MLLRILTTGCLVAGALVATSAPSMAGNACPSSDSVVVSTSGTVTATDPDWWRYSSANGSIVTMVATSGDPDMKIVNATCGTVVCYPYRGGTETCVLPPGSYNIGFLYYSGPGGVAAYSVSVASTQCSDGIDNDEDGRVDYPNDPGCAGPDDTAEGVDCTDTAGVRTCVGISEGPVVVQRDLQEIRIEPGPEHHVVAKVDVYRFTLPTGDSVSLPCVVMAADATGSNPCATAGGVYVSHVLTLVDSTVTEPSISLGDPIASVAICSGELVATANGIGITSFQAYTYCGSLATIDPGPSR